MGTFVVVGRLLSDKHSQFKWQLKLSDIDNVTTQSIWSEFWIVL